ncbi:MAG: hypothetical protein R2751_05465 [Bacteroidales bacterium]
MVHDLIIAFSLGLIGGVIPGPVITAVFTEILQSGHAKSLRIVGIAFVTESLVAVVSLLVLVALPLPRAVFHALSLGGALLLLWIAASLWRVKSLDSGNRVHFRFWKIIAMILSNGVLWTYWITICIPKALMLQQSMPLGAYLFMGLVQLGWLSSTLLLTVVFARFRPLLSRPGAIPVVFKVFALAFVYFSLDMGWTGLRFFLG